MQQPTGQEERVTETQPTSGDGSLPVHIHAVDQGNGGAGFLRGKSDRAGSQVGGVLAAVAQASGGSGWGPSPAGRGAGEREWLTSDHLAQGMGKHRGRRSAVTEAQPTSGDGSLPVHIQG